MKTKITITLCLIIFTLVSCRNSDNIDIKVVDSDNVYRYTATFPRSKSRQVERFINSRIAPSSIRYDDDVDLTTILDDRTKFDYEASPGELEIELDKNENSRESYIRIKEMCQGLNQIINPKI
ncbi:hypothetical protein [Dyadobacter arcticus]|uniref:Lipoprotein NlpE involved in copper resistance n=1 Tax=Dyadobacter arcticus TaxID=1078754 RepID=A0ABX0UQV9_9BACT|nr:hypothetical protein [Dyadobacter arcticus]NIJ54309.1 putative lipoprotein NlpE involved in copper resistance [Dyadobacter arcticus]